MSPRVSVDRQEARKVVVYSLKNNFHLEIFRRILFYERFESERYVIKILSTAI
jgi:hypothetical protein